VSSLSPVNRLLPVFAKEIKDGARMINARAETVHQKPAYRRAFKSQRALIPVDAFYEWLETDEIGKSGKKGLTSAKDLVSGTVPCSGYGHTHAYSPVRGDRALSAESGRAQQGV
jgi:hypothetical protein